VIVAFDLVSSRDGTRHSVRASGEALDPSDKATAKALSAAYKSAMLQTFCIPANNEEADAFSHRAKYTAGVAEPLQGWPVWAQDLIGTIAICETHEALDRVRITHSSELLALSRGRSDLYRMIGDAFSSRMKEITSERAPPTRRSKVASSPGPSSATDAANA
jgi:hypothetical protein